jgi:hypothetical protein
LKWTPHEIEGKVYDLSHLHSFSFELVVPEKDGKPRLTYQIRVDFSWHCFTRSARDGESYLSIFEYKHGNETRLFCEERYALSKPLPEIIRSIGDRKCFHAKDSNFFTVEAMNREGQRVEYSIFFTVFASGKNGLTLTVQSAYLRDGVPVAQRRPIRFSIIAFNVVSGKPIKVPK